MIAFHYSTLGHLLIRRSHIVAPRLLQLLMRPVIVPELLFPGEVDGDGGCALGELRSVTCQRNNARHSAQ